MKNHTKHLHPAVALCLLAMTVIGLSACGSSKQKLSVKTSPTDAEVLLERRGDLVIDVSVPTYGSGDLAAGKFEDDFITLWYAPVKYEFDLSESQGSINIKGAGGSATKHYREGTIRVLLPGYQTIERLVAFSGSPIELHLTMQRTN